MLKREKNIRIFLVIFVEIKNHRHFEVYVSYFEFALNINYISLLSDEFIGNLLQNTA